MQNPNQHRPHPLFDDTDSEMTVTITFQRILVVTPSNLSQQNPHHPFYRRFVPIPDDVQCPDCSGLGFSGRYQADYFEVHPSPRMDFDCSYCGTQFTFLAIGRVIIRG